MKIDRIMAIASGILAVVAFFYPMLIINGEKVTLFGQGYLSGFTFVLFGVAIALMGVHGKLKHIFWPGLGLCAAGVTFTIQLQDTLKATAQDYAQFKGFLANQMTGKAQEFGVDLEAVQGLAVSWDAGLYVAMASYVCVSLAYLYHNILYRKSAVSSEF
jgi:hypothetical protein